MQTDPPPLPLYTPVPPAVERGVAKCAPYFAEAPRTAKALGRFTVQTAAVEEVGGGTWRCGCEKGVSAGGAGTAGRAWQGVHAPLRGPNPREPLP